MHLFRPSPRILPYGWAVALAAGLVAPGGWAAQDGIDEKAAQAGEALGVDLYHSFAARDGNIVFSPHCISDMLALLSEGAEGTTRQELLQALHWSETRYGVAEAFGAQDRHLDRSAQGDATLAVANGLWYQRGEEPLRPFLLTAQGEFGAEVRSADFTGNASAVQLEINRWVGQKTLGKIPDLIPRGALNGGTRLAVVDAVYFKGRWERPFEAHETEPRPFFILPGTSVMAPQMTAREELRETSEPDCDLLELPYRGGRLSMVILLPRASDGLPALEQRLTPSSLLEWLAALDFSKQKNMHVTLPRFRMTYAAELTEALRKSGVTAAFDPIEADFSAINGKRDLHVSTVLHKAFLDVNEEGTEAAASTFGGVVTFGIERSDEFRADHPFLFLIRDNTSGTLLFLGRVVDPLAM